MTGQRKILLEVDDVTYGRLAELMQELNTTVGGVLSQGLALLSKAQGKTLILRDNKSDIDLEIRTYSKNSA